MVGLKGSFRLHYQQKFLPSNWSVNVGFTTDNQDSTFEFDASLPGNFNARHDTYGTDSLTDEQRWQLVEYLKTL